MQADVKCLAVLGATCVELWCG